MRNQAARNRETTARKLVFLFTVLGVLIVLFGLIRLSAAEPVEFADPALYEAVVEGLDVPEGRPVTRTELSGLEELDASGYGIQSLEGIEYLTHLVRLDLSDNRVTDVAPLSELRRLRSLSLRNNRITSLEDIRFDALIDTQLTKLSLRHNVSRIDDAPQERLSDISLLSHFDSLEVLELRDNHIANLAPLASLVRLEELDLRENRFNDIRPLQELTRLRELNIRENSVHDLSPLRELAELRYLNIHSNTRLASLEPLADLDQLETLIMRNVPVDDNLEFLNGFSNLRRLNVRNTGIESLASLGSLMEQGALQTDLSRGIQAVVDIRDNPVPDPTVENDPFAPIRNYWNNISSRDPRALPQKRISPPQFSERGGLHTEAFELSLSHSNESVRIYYTLDGSVPDPNENSQATREYEGRISVDSKEAEPYIGSYHASYGDRGELNILGDVFQGTVVRAVAIDPESGVRSRAETHTYLVGEDIHERYELPIVAINTDPAHLVDYEQGIYVPGRIFDDIEPLWRGGRLGHENRQPANFHQRGRHSVAAGGLEVQSYGADSVALRLEDHGFELDFSYVESVPFVTISGTENYDGGHHLSPSSTEDVLVIRTEYVPEQFSPGARIEADWERQVNMEYYEGDGTPAFSQPLGVRAHGGTSRHRHQKHLRFYARSEYSDRSLVDSRDFIEHPFFGAHGPERFTRVLFRNTMERSGLNDILGQQFLRHIHPTFDIQDYAPVVVFLNGEFWGWYAIRDRYDHWYFANRYGVDPREIGIVQDRDGLRWGDENDYGHYQSMLNLARNADLSDEHAFAELSRVLDIESYAAWMINGIFLVYRDWGRNHMQFWRYNNASSDTDESEVLDGRWRPMALDLDGVFDRSSWSPEVDFVSEKTRLSRFLLGDLLENEEFEKYFINRMADTLNTVFREDISLGFVDEVVNELPEQVLLENSWRWRGREDIEWWYAEVDHLRDFLRDRPQHMWAHMKEHFTLSDPVELTVRTEGELAGSVQVNTLVLEDGVSGVSNSSHWSGEYFPEIPVTLEAEPHDGAQFTRWEFVESGEGETIWIEDSSIELYLSKNTTVTAHFREVSE